MVGWGEFHFSIFNLSKFIPYGTQKMDANLLTHWWKSMSRSIDDWGSYLTKKNYARACAFRASNFVDVSTTKTQNKAWNRHEKREWMAVIFTFHPLPTLFPCQIIWFVTFLQRKDKSIFWDTVSILVSYFYSGLYLNRTMYITHGLESNHWIHDLKSAFLHLKFKGFRLPILPLFFYNLANLFQYHQSSI